MDCCEDLLHGFCFTVCAQDCGLCVTFCTKDLCLLFTLCTKDGCAGFAFCGQNVGLLLAFCGEDCGAAVTLCTHLLFHGVLDGCRGLDFLDVHAGDAQAPAAGGGVEYASQFRVDLVAGGEGLLQVQATDDVTQGCAGQFVHGANVVGDFVGCGLGVGDLEVHDGVDADHEVIFGNHGLRGEGNDLFTQVDEGQHAVNYGDDDVQAGVENGVELTQSFDDAGSSLRDDAHGLCEHRQHEEDE